MARAEAPGSNRRGSSEPVTRPRIVLTFAGVGMADVLDVAMDGISLGQLYAAAWQLDALARELRQGDATRKALESMTPGGGSALADVLAGLKRNQEGR